MDEILLMVVALPALAFAPGAFWLWYIARKDRWEPEPARYVIALFFWGMISTVPAIIASIPLHLVLPEQLHTYIGPIVLAPFFEEPSKFLFLWWATRLFKGFNREIDEPMDGIVYAAAVALGFASLENATYLISAHAKGELIYTFTVRAFLSVPGHVLFSSMWGYAWGMARFKAKDGKRGAMPVVAGMALAILFHGVFNTIATISIPASIVFLVLLVAAFWVVLRRNIKVALGRSPHKKDDA